MYQGVHFECCGFLRIHYTSTELFKKEILTQALVGQSRGCRGQGPSSAAGKNGVAMATAHAVAPEVTAPARALGHQVL